MKISGAAWTDEQIADVISRIARGETRQSIAVSYGVTSRAIRHMLGGRRAVDMAHGSAVGSPAAPEQVGPFPDFPGMRPVCQQSTSGSAPAMYAGGLGSSTGAGSDPRKDPALHCPQAPAGYHLRGVSTLLGGDGQPVQQWIKTARDPAQDKLDEIWRAIQSLPEPFRTEHRPSPAPRGTDSDLMCLYPLADAHLGLYCWAEETGADYDIDRAEELHVEAIRELTENAPAADSALIAILGDFIHCDNDSARTARSGAPLDTDTRWAKVARVALRTARALVDACLSKHRSVRLVVVAGNHDDYSAAMLSLALEAFYERDPRVSVDDSRSPYKWHRFGQCLFGFAHGDSPKLSDLPGIMADDRRTDWGSTAHHRWYTGHVHQQRLYEYRGCIVESLGTLAAPDAWSTRQGYRSERYMRVDTWHRERGYRGHFVAGIGKRDAA